jgi:hypothetical protein
MTSGTAGERNYITVCSIDGRFSQRGAVEAHVDQSLGKALSVQLGNQGVNDIHQASCLGCLIGHGDHCTLFGVTEPSLVLRAGHSSLFVYLQRSA